MQESLHKKNKKVRNFLNKLPLYYYFMLELKNEFYLSFYNTIVGMRNSIANLLIINVVQNYLTPIRIC